MKKGIQKIEQLKTQSLGHQLLKSARLFDERAREVLKERNGGIVKKSHIHLMPYIDFSGTNLKVVAERAGISKQAVGQLVDEMEELGMLERVPDPRDGRAKLVRFTKKGRKAIEQGLEVIAKVEETLVMAIGKKKSRELHELLSKVEESLT